jgi:hypothetical protein
MVGDHITNTFLHRKACLVISVTPDGKNDRQHSLTAGEEMSISIHQICGDHHACCLVKGV